MVGAGKTRAGGWSGKVRGWWGVGGLGENDTRSGSSCVASSCGLTKSELEGDDLIGVALCSEALCVLLLGEAESPKDEERKCDQCEECGDEASNGCH